MAKRPPTLDPTQRKSVRISGWVLGLFGMMILEWHNDLVYMFGGCLLFAAGFLIDWADHNG